MSLEITGKLIQKLELQSGVSRTGTTWQKQEFVIETIEQYPKKVCANLWGDKIEILNRLNIGETITVGVSLESREFNGKWYTDVRAWKIDIPSMAPPVASPAMSGVINAAPYQPGEMSASAMPPNAPTSAGSFVDEMPSFTDEDMNDDLPF